MVTYELLSTNYRKSHRSILSRGRHNRILHKRPLPTQEQESQQKHVSTEEDESEDPASDTDDELEVDSGADAQELHVKPKSRKTSKKKKPTKKRRKQLDSEDESDDENHHPSISHGIRKAKKFQRLDSNRIQMARTKVTKRSGPPAKGKKRKHEDEESCYEDSDAEQDQEEMLLMLDKPTQQYVKNDPKDKNEFKNVVRNKFKELVYPHYKFITNTAGMLQIAGITFDNMDFKGKAEWSQKRLVKEKNKFVHDYADFIRDAILRLRNQDQSALRVWAVKGIQTPEGIPKPEDLISVAKCQGLQGDGDNVAQNRAIFDLYVDVILPKVASNKRWGAQKRHFGLLSTHAPENDPKKPYVTPADEAFALVTYEGCLTKWKYMAKQKAAGAEVDKKNDDMENKYVNRKSGQARFGGWTDEGLDRFKELRDAIVRARNKKKVCKEVEEACLKRLRTKHKVDDKIAKRDADPKKRPKEKSAYASGCGLV